jgi:Kef-type K+ transport system membrane component KefB
MSQIWTVLYAVAGLFMVKGLLIAVIFRLMGRPFSEALQAGLTLGQAGEFAFMAVGAAAIGGLLQKEISQFMLIVVSASLLVTPMVSLLARRLARWMALARSRHSQADAACQSSRVARTRADRGLWTSRRNPRRHTQRAEHPVPGV